MSAPDVASTPAAADPTQAPPSDATAAANPTHDASLPVAEPAKDDPSAATKPSEPSTAKSDETDAQAKSGTESATAVAEASEGASAALENGATAATSTPKANDKKRRSSAGVPEHKSKKGSKKKTEVLHLDAKPGDYYFARMKGWPPWPAMICDEEILPETLLSSRPVTAMRSDGTYREDFDTDGKNVRDRTYAVMFLGTYEFSWLANYDLMPLDLEEIKTAKPDKKSKALWAAYEIAQEGHNLDHFKELLLQHERDVAEQQQEAAAAAAAAEAKKAAAAEAKKAAAERRKSKGSEKKAAKDKEDASMVDAEGNTSIAEGKAKGKKRKKTAEDDSELAEGPKTKLKLSTPKDKESTSKPKPKKAAKPSPPKLSEAEMRAKREKEVLYLRHRLQKGFLTRDVAPKEEEMQQMADYFNNLEAYTDLETSIIRVTKIHKVLKNIIKLNAIPKDEEFQFKKRSVALLEIWHKALADDTASSPTAGKEENAPNGVPATNGEPAAEAGNAPKVESAATEAKPNGTSESTSAAPKPSEADGDVSMADLSTLEAPKDAVKPEVAAEPTTLAAPAAAPTETAVSAES